jgi:hypothetical protein
VPSQRPAEAEHLSLGQRRRHDPRASQPAYGLAGTRRMEEERYAAAHDGPDQRARRDVREVVPIV